jgi:hypothetical protein
MRYKKSNLIARRNKVLPIKFVKQDMTTYSGLTFIDHFLRLYGIHRRIKASLKPYNFKGDYHIGDILYVLLITVFLGAERLRHLEYLKNDPLFCRIVRLTRIPHRTKISSALKQSTSDSLKALIELNSELVTERLDMLGLKEITIDLDGTVLSTKGNPSWAFKGYNPIKRGAKSYFPLTAHVAETGHFVSIINRPGNVHDSNRSLFMVKMLKRQLGKYSLRFRADSAFCGPKLINYLLFHTIPFAIKAPFWKILALKEAAQQRQRWFNIDKTWSYFWIKDPIESIEHEHYVVILRKKLAKPKPNFQLNLFSPNNGVYEYSAVVTHSKAWKPKELLFFVSGRSGQENSISELKSDFAFDRIPTMAYQANSAYLQISQMAFNQSISMQHEMGLSRRHRANPKTTRIFKTMKWKTFKFLILNRAGRIAWDDGKKVLYLTYNKATKQLFNRISQSLNQKHFQKAA